VLPDDARKPPGALSVGDHELGWLDALKGIAILAVVIDHGFIVDDYVVWKHLYFAVSWFIFLAGVSNTHSARRRCFRPLKDSLPFWRKRAGALVGPYLAASGIAFLVLDPRHPSAGMFFDRLALFNGLPQLYFVPLLLQLLALFPILFAALYLFGWLGRAAVALTIIPVAAVLSRLVTFPWVLGAHYLFGASFLYLFVLGMLAEPYLSARRPKPAVWLACAVPLFAWAERLNLSTNGDLMTHPPSNVLVLYAVALALVCYALCCQFAGSLPVRAAAQLGRRSFDIFLYHYLFLLPILQFRNHAWTNRLPVLDGQLVLMAAAIPIAVAGSILTARGLTGLRLSFGRLLAVYPLGDGPAVSVEQRAAE